jgi:hypothetical protein
MSPNFWHNHLKKKSYSHATLILPETNNNVSLHAATITTSIAAGSLLSGSSSTVGNNSALGYQFGWNLTSAGSNNCTFLGANSNVSSTSTSYTFSIHVS